MEQLPTDRWQPHSAACYRKRGKQLAMTSSSLPRWAGRTRCAGKKSNWLRKESGTPCIGPEGRDADPSLLVWRSTLKSKADRSCVNKTGQLDLLTTSASRLY